MPLRDEGHPHQGAVGVLSVPGIAAAGAHILQVRFQSLLLLPAASTTMAAEGSQRRKLKAIPSMHKSPNPAWADIADHEGGETHQGGDGGENTATPPS